MPHIRALYAHMVMPELHADMAGAGDVLGDRVDGSHGRGVVEVTCTRTQTTLAVPRGDDVIDVCPVFDAALREFLATRAQKSAAGLPLALTSGASNTTSFK